MTDFLQNPGTNGFTVTPFNLQTTELNSLANNVTVVSSVGGTSGVFSQANNGSYIMGAAWFVSGGTFTPVAGGSLYCWFLRSSDGGTTFEKTVANGLMPRGPDFTISFHNAAHAVDNIVWANGGEIVLPFEHYKLWIFNATGVTLPASGNKILLAPVGIVRV